MPPSESPRMLRVFFDHGHRWPLWEAGNKPNMDPADYGFSPELTLLLRQWHEVWEPIADYEIGQPVPEPTPDMYAREAALQQAAITRIRQEAPAGVIVDASLLED